MKWSNLKEIIIKIDVGSIWGVIGNTMAINVDYSGVYCTIESEIKCKLKFYRKKVGCSLILRCN